MAAEGAEVAAAAEVAGVADAEPVVEAAASRGELAAGARADRFPITLKTNSSWPGSTKSTRPMHVLLGGPLPVTISAMTCRLMCNVPRKSRRAAERDFDSFENAWALAPGKLRALT